MHGPRQFQTELLWPVAGCLYPKKDLCHSSLWISLLAVFTLYNYFGFFFIALSFAFSTVTNMIHSLISAVQSLKYHLSQKSRQYKHLQLSKCWVLGLTGIWTCERGDVTSVHLCLGREHGGVILVYTFPCFCLHRKLRNSAVPWLLIYTLQMWLKRLLSPGSDLMSPICVLIFNI